MLRDSIRSLNDPFPWYTVSNARLRVPSLSVCRLWMQINGPIYYDSQFADVLSKMLALRARWYEYELKEKTGVKNTLIILNEPYLASLGSSVVPIDIDSVRSGWDDIVSLVEGSIGVHCCSNTDWGFLFSLGPAVVSFDAYTTSKEILLYRDDLLAYMEGGGVVAWGIVPAEWRVFSNETTDSLYERYLAIRNEVTSYIPENLFDAQSLITPSCGYVLPTNRNRSK